MVVNSDSVVDCVIRPLLRQICWNVHDAGLLTDISHFSRNHVASCSDILIVVSMFASYILGICTQPQFTALQGGMPAKFIFEEGAGRERTFESAQVKFDFVEVHAGDPCLGEKQKKNIPLYPYEFGLTMWEAVHRFSATKELRALVFPWQEKCHHISVTLRCSRISSCS